MSDHKLDCNCVTCRYPGQGYEPAPTSKGRDYEKMAREAFYGPHKLNENTTIHFSEHQDISKNGHADIIRSIAESYRTLAEEVAGERDAEYRKFWEESPLGLPWTKAYNDLRAQLQEKEKMIAEMHKDYGCELRDPNGTIWEHAANLQKQLAEKEKEVERLQKTFDCVSAEAGVNERSLRHRLAQAEATIKELRDAKGTNKEHTK